MIETIYLDSRNRCHRTDDGSMTAVNTDFFSGKCNTFVEGHVYEVSDGYNRIYPWKPYNELKAAQAQYERDMADLQAAYQEGVNSAYD